MHQRGDTLNQTRHDMRFWVYGMATLLYIVVMFCTVLVMLPVAQIVDAKTGRQQSIYLFQPITSTAANDAGLTSVRLCICGVIILLGMLGGIAETMDSPHQ